jgi:hypothetical protein
MKSVLPFYDFCRALLIEELFGAVVSAGKSLVQTG